MGKKVKKVEKPNRAKKQFAKPGKGGKGSKGAVEEKPAPPVAPPSAPKQASEPVGSMMKSIGVARSQAVQQMTNRQKCLVIGSRNMSANCRHLMLDLRNMLPHTRSHEKIPTRDNAAKTLQELCNLHHCNSCLFLEGRKHATTFLWLAQLPAGPSVKFELLNVHTADELRMAGNCLKYSRAMLHFDNEFDVAPHLRIMKSLLTTLFNVPRYHPRSKPFIDHMICCYYLDDRIWIRHYQIVTPPPATPNKKREGIPSTEPDVELREDGPTPAQLSAALHHASKSELEQMRLMEIGPRMVLEPLTILNGAFEGSVLYKNTDAQTPTEKRQTRKMRLRRKADENAYLAQVSERHKLRNPAPRPDPLGDVFA